MVRWGLISAMLAACGRIGFDSLPDAAPDVTLEVPADLANLPCEVDYGTVDTLAHSDQIRVVYDSGAPYVVDVHHVSMTQHDVHAYRLTMRGDALISTDLGVIYTLPDIAGLNVEAAGSEHVLVLSDVVGVQTRVLRFDTSFALLSNTPVGSFQMGLPPYARSTAGRMVAGIASGSVLQVRPLDASFATTGPAVTVTSPADAASIAPAGADFIVAWTVAGQCRFARVNATGSVVAGPLSLNPGTSCTEPHAALLGGGRIAYVVHDSPSANSITAFGGTFDAALTAATAPAPLGASLSFADELVVMGDRTRVPVFSGGTVRIVDISAAGTISTVGADIGTVVYDALWIEQVASASVLFRVENKHFVVRRLCR